MSASQERALAAPAHAMAPLERAIHGILAGGIVLSVALMATGLVLGVAQGSGLPRGVVALGELPHALAALWPAAYLSLGLIVLIGTPFVRVVGSIVVFARERDRLYVLITAIVFLVMCLGVALGKV